MNGQRIATRSMRTAHLDSGEATTTSYWSPSTIPTALCGQMTASGREVERWGITAERLAKLPLCKRCKKAYDKEQGL